VSFFFKQWGGVRKSKAGRELDGKTYDAIAKPSYPSFRTTNNSKRCEMTDLRIRAAHQRPNATNDQVRLLPDELDFGNNLGFDYIKASTSPTLPPKVEEESEENWIDRPSVQPYLIAFLCLFCGAMLALPIVALTRNSSPTNEPVEEVTLPPARVAPQLTLKSVEMIPALKFPELVPSTDLEKNPSPQTPIPKVEPLPPTPQRYWLITGESRVLDAIADNPENARQTILNDYGPIPGNLLAYHLNEDRARSLAECIDMIMKGSLNPWYTDDCIHCTASRSSVLARQADYCRREWRPALHLVDMLIKDVHLLEEKACISKHETFRELAFQLTQLRNELELRSPWSRSGCAKPPPELESYLRACRFRVRLLEYWSGKGEEPGIGLFFPLPPLPPCPKYGVSGH
jgi:hypothetical protein